MFKLRQINQYLLKLILVQYILKIKIINNQNLLKIN